MARKKLKPVTIAGIEFDALVDEQKSYSSSIPTYPVEGGYPVSDTIINDPIQIQMTLYISNTPVTWLYRHGRSTDRIDKICKEIENMWFEKKLVKVVTTDCIYTNMGITSISIKKSRELGYAREIPITMQKVVVTKRKVTKIPSYILKSGTTKTSAGTASTSKKSSKTSSKSTSSTKKSTSSSNSKSSGTSSSSKKSSSSKTSSKLKSSAKKNKSILYGVADKFGFI